MNIGKRLQRINLAMMMGAVVFGLGSASAHELTPEQRCQVAKDEANWKWHRCRSMVSIRDLKHDLSDEVEERRRARCDDRHDQAYDRANQKALQQGASACAGDSDSVQAAMLGNTIAILGSGPSRDNFGVNIFGASGFEDQTSMITTLFQQGVRKFRVNNIGGWPDWVYEDIDTEAAKLSDSEKLKVSVYVPSQYFSGQFDVDQTKSKFAQWSNISHWIVQLDACDPTTNPGDPLYCKNPTETGLDQLNSAQLSQYLSKIPGWVQAFQGQSYTIEFVIPCNDCFPKPAANLAVVKKATVDAFPQVRFTLERTKYPFWGGDSTTSTNFPFGDADAFDQLAKTEGFAGAYFAESGWPRRCDAPSIPHAPATQPNQCAYLKSILHGTYREPLFVTYYWLMGAENVDLCGADSWGLFTTSTPPALACPGSF